MHTCTVRVHLSARQPGGRPVARILDAWSTVHFSSSGQNRVQRGIPPLRHSTAAQKNNELFRYSICFPFHGSDRLVESNDRHLHFVVLYAITLLIVFSNSSNLAYSPVCTYAMPDEDMSNRTSGAWICNLDSGTYPNLNHVLGLVWPVNGPSKMYRGYVPGRRITDQEYRLQNILVESEHAIE
jgi:hypothetical protein